MGTDRTNAAYKYNVKAYDQLNIRIPKGDKAIIQAIAADYGYSLAAFVAESINYNIRRLDDQRKAQQDLIKVLNMIIDHKKAKEYHDFYLGLKYLIEPEPEQEGHKISSDDDNIH